MTRTGAEALILTINALGTGILMFVAGVAQKIMNDMDELDFKRFLNLLDKRAMGDPFAVTIATLPIIAAIPYFVIYRFNHWWFTAGIVLWFVGSAITKVTNMPIYKRVANPKNTDPGELRKDRRKLEVANTARAWITLLSVLLMACQFSAVGVVIATAAAALLAFPLLLLARHYSPGRAAGTITG